MCRNKKDGYRQRNVRQFLQSAKAQFGYLRRFARYVVAFTRFAGGGIWLPQDSLRHWPPLVNAPGTIAANVTWMEREFNACQTHRSMYVPFIFNRFLVIQPISSRVRHFSTFLHIWPRSPGYASGTIAVNVTWMERGFNAGHRSMYRCIAHFCTFWPPLGTPLGQSR